jgi:hypothetical protein
VTAGAPDAAWTAYARALATLAEAQDALALADAGRRARQQRRHTDLASLRESVERHGTDLVQLAARLDVPVGEQDLSTAGVGQPVGQGLGQPVGQGLGQPVDRPLEPGAGPERWDDEFRALQAQDAAVEAITLETVEVAHRPQLLPQWSGTVARPAVVYLLFCLPNAVFTVLLSGFGVTGNSALAVWFIAAFPLIAMIGGGALVGRLCAPKLTRPTLQDMADQAAGRPPRPPSATVKRRRWLGLLFAWGSWLGPGLLLDWLTGLGS